MKESVTGAITRLWDSEFLDDIATGTGGSGVFIRSGKKKKEKKGEREFWECVFVLTVAKPFQSLKNKKCSFFSF